ncbi:amino acid/amide ABC transporter membrane protein 2 (HAAT family) /amino acid/amide ABC transporter ATP-binding protein 1 (HAAT family) [Azorhizobium sp. AG788]|uniref:branched-chain amino acid ABC transporter ATP-binding protein/permease n=1 Tax=Azorhizobium sp. AG788 TaxID=2183897 RepID=UPI00105F5756|nr:branched-chain amino acid ABC transporter ATP-binding protein/permease [Azorhizobium sp. AG788]TDT94960.1 amino acid/amide ABC transporter membrane protein 2 (HAAT family) /amino acid/amide ABC transporter ATP-binding protein 1 (HAAT family) [Azorhizobium sp. AG788]
MARCLPILTLLAAALALQALSGEHAVSVLNYIGLYALVALGLVVLTGITGQTSFGQAAFAGIAAYATAVIATRFGLGPLVTLPAALLSTAVAAFLIAAITLRLSGHYLPLSTIAWGISLFYLFGNIEMLGGHTGIDHIPPLSLFGHELTGGRELGVIIWGLVALAVWAVSNLLDSAQGRALRAVKDAPLMAETFGVDTVKEKRIAFVFAALLAGLSGWLYAYLLRFVNPSPFSLSIGIEYLFMVVVGGAGYVWGAIIGAALITLAREWLQDFLPVLLGTSGNFETVVFGGLIIFLLHRADGGVAERLAGLVRRLPFLHPSDAGEAAAAPQLPVRPRLPAGGDLLVVDSALKQFPGLVAVSSISLKVRTGEILGLIGPNGAGKSTLFNLISGTLNLTSGTITFEGQVISGRTPRQIGDCGLARTFQHVKMMPNRSVLENVMLGAHRRAHAGVLSSCLHMERQQEAAIRAEAIRQIRRVGLEDVMMQPAGSLPLGKQRILEIARALAADPILLLLDEPAAGLRLPEKKLLYKLLRQLRAEGLTILIVEHDMDFVMSLVDRLVVMSFGQLICEGDPAKVQGDQRVVEAYLGDAA